MGTGKQNCWEVRGCGRGPESLQPCPAATDVASDGVNDGICAGRICWTVPGTDCSGEARASFVDKLEACLSCEFFAQVKAEQGKDFRLLKLGQGIYDAPELHATIARIESFLRIPEDLHTQFDLRRLLDRITLEVRRTLGADASVVFLLEGDPPVLRGEMLLREQRVPVVIPLDESSAVGAAAVRNHAINVRNPYASSGDDSRSVPFNQAFDEQCNVRTTSLLAIPIRDSTGQPIGVITAANSARGEFSADDQWFMEQYALQAALAIEKARLLTDSRFVGRLATFGETLAGLSHALRGITHALRGLTYIIRQAVRADRPQDIEAACQILDRQIERIVSLARGVSAYEAERTEGPELAEVDQVVSDVVRTFSEEAAARAVTLEVELNGSPKAGLCQRTLLYRLLVNLLAHAFDACAPSGGRVTVRTLCNDQGSAIVQVTHNGPPPQTADLQREEWWDTCQAHAGQSVGLPTVLHLARALGGRVDVGAAAGESGTVYQVSFPLAPLEEAMSADQRANNPT